MFTNLGNHVASGITALTGTSIHLYLFAFVVVAGM